VTARAKQYGSTVHAVTKPANAACCGALFCASQFVAKFTIEKPAPSSGQIQTTRIRPEMNRDIPEGAPALAEEEERLTKEYPQSHWWAPGGFSSLQFGHFIRMQDPSELNISSLICYRRAIVVTLRLWTLRVHPLNDESCALSIKRSPIKPFASSPTESANFAQRGAGRKSA
jgi:hypothetical protein